MEIVDANVILRYILNDNEDFSETSAKILENHTIYIPFEIVAEVVYVLEKVYGVKRREIHSSISDLVAYPNIDTYDSGILSEALSLFKSSQLDFVDTLIFAYK